MYKKLKIVKSKAFLKYVVFPASGFLCFFLGVKVHGGFALLIFPITFCIAYYTKND
jgi:hypothetical protein